MPLVCLDSLPSKVVNLCNRSGMVFVSDVMEAIDNGVFFNIRGMGKSTRDHIYSALRSLDGMASDLDDAIESHSSR